MPDFAFHPMGFDLNRAWGPSALLILDFTVSLSLPPARIGRRSIQVIYRTISPMNASLIRAAPAAALSQPGPIRAVDGVTRLPLLFGHR
jgi:hypothetical protein